MSADDRRVTLVVGGSGGIGSATSRLLAERGHRVIVGYNANRAAADEVVGSLTGLGHASLQIQVTDAASVSAAARWITDDVGRLDALVNSSGVTRPVPHADLDGLDDDLIDEIFRANWRGPFAVIRALLPLIRRSPAAVIVNISSIAGVTGIGSNVAYCASKAALDSMTRSLARALAPEVRVVSVSPGWVEGAYAQRMAPQMLDEQRRATPLQRLAGEDDVARAVLASMELLTMTTGSIIPVDGGRPLGAS
jgi:3-oxoacyl-[acyl-carrier protein] reductase